MRCSKKNDHRHGGYSVLLGCLLLIIGAFTGCDSGVGESDDAEVTVSIGSDGEEWIKLVENQPFLTELLPLFPGTEEELDELIMDREAAYEEELALEELELNEQELGSTEFDTEELLQPEDLQDDTDRMRLGYNPYGYRGGYDSYYDSGRYNDPYYRAYGGDYRRDGYYGRYNDPYYRGYDRSGSGRGGYCEDWFSFAGELPRSPWRGVSVYGRRDRTGCPGFNTPLNISVCVDRPGEFLPNMREAEDWVRSWARDIALIDARGNYCNNAQIVAPSSRFNPDCVTVGVAWGCDRGGYSYGGRYDRGRYDRGRYDGYYGGY